MNLFSSNIDGDRYLVVKSTGLKDQYETKNILYYEDFLSKTNKMIYKIIKTSDFFMTNFLRVILGPISSASDVYLFKMFIKNFKKEFDYIVVPLMPIDIYLAIKDTVDKKKILPVLFDYISDNVFAGSRYPFKARLIKKAILFEANLVKSSKLVYYTDGIGDNFRKNHPNYKNKLIKINTPLFIHQKNHRQINNTVVKNNYRLVYAGTFYKGLRPIEDLLTFFNALGDYLLLNGKNLEADIYTSYIKTPNLDNLNTYTRINGYLNSKELSNKIYDADIIVVMGNNYLDQSPSKVIEFMSYNKPLIYLYYLEDDVLLRKLRFDDASIAINLKEIDYDLLFKFLTKLADRDYKKLSFLRDYSPESVMESIIDTINDYEDE